MGSIGIQKNVGEKLHLNLQLHDGVDTMPKRVFVNLLGPAGAVLATGLELSHTTGGFFVEDTQIMPDQEVVTAIFSVTEPDGSTESVDHGIAFDRYEKSVPVEVDLPDAIIPKPFAIKVQVRTTRVAVKTPTNRIKVRVRNE